MHKNHFVGCAAGIAIALVVVALSGGSAGSLGVLVAVLVCPVAMVAAMCILMGGHQDAGNTGPQGNDVAARGRR